MIVLERIAAVRARCDEAVRAGKSVGLVPTMGYLHEGHRTLMRAARAENDLVVVTLFVNPTQFGPNEDLASYPRDPEGDARVVTEEGVDVLFAPSVAEMYPRPGLTHVTVDEVTDGLCGASRPHHFVGVATVVTKLFSIVGPCTAYFGKKDFQQLVVVRRLVEDLNLPITVVGVSTVREPDGLALSSRNAYLAPDDRPAATVLYRALECAIATVKEGERDPVAVRAAAVTLVEREPLAQFDYLEVRRADDLAEVEHLDDGVEHVIALAVFLNTTRLIDNATFTVDGAAVHYDLPGRSPVAQEH
ncbi:MAG: pantoate--beta-alanine ligase [Actinobacteria bacterium]|nr:pantoate--beta-alanine ligase [Actinomycetota bacterium]